MKEILKLLVILKFLKEKKEIKDYIKQLLSQIFRFVNTNQME